MSFDEAVELTVGWMQRDMASATKINNDPEHARILHGVFEHEAWCRALTDGAAAGLAFMYRSDC